MVHNGTMTGEYSKKSYMKEGPANKGFILWLQIQKIGTVNQAVLPQILILPYWKTFLNVTAIDKTETQLYWGLSFNRNSDRKLLDKLKKAIYALDKKIVTKKNK
ncbi:MAG: hypothetical protein COA79_18000 [Planctomycetota bacterium]|nr:MAG: hypothetical protein COA79_18000 [Planctomycetota bacterium]